MRLLITAVEFKHGSVIMSHFYIDLIIHPCNNDHVGLAKLREGFRNHVHGIQIDTCVVQRPKAACGQWSILIRVPHNDT